MAIVFLGNGKIN